MSKILIADDEVRMRKVLSDFLRKEGHEVVEASDGAEAFKVFYENTDIGVVILDVMMPEHDGWFFCKEIRKESQVPIIMLTAKTRDQDEVYSLEIGADEYIKKPFIASVLVARVRALLRRTEINFTLNNIGGLVVVENAREVILDGQRIDLTPKEYNLLVYLIKNKGLALSREQIITTIWEERYFGELRTIDTHITKLREKLKEKGDLIKTVRGYGYKFEEAT